MGSCYLKKMPVLLEIERIFIHPDFVPSSLKNDIAILQVKEDIPPQYNFPVRLPCPHIQNYCYNIGHTVRVIGFGKEEDRDRAKFVEQLKEVDLRVKSMEESKYHKSMVTNDMFLAGGILGNTILDSCTGDSGGPCLKFFHDCWVLVGIVSWGDSCGKKDAPGVYTKVLNYYYWIRSVCGFSHCNTH